MPNVFDHTARLAMRMRGYRVARTRTSIGPTESLVFDGRGKLPPLVILHGWASTGVHYIFTGHGLKHVTKRLVLPDLPGHGWSATPQGLDPSTAIRGVIETLDAVLDEPAVILGSSLGGLAATRYALARPDNVLGLVLVSPFGAPLHHADRDALIELVRARTPLQAKRFLDRLAGRPQLRNWLFAPEMWRILNKPVFQTLLDHVDTMPLLTPDDRARLHTPTTLIWGHHERLLPESQLAFWEGLPDVRVWRPRNSAHSPAVDEPWAFERMVQHALVRAAEPTEWIDPWSRRPAALHPDTSEGRRWSCGSSPSLDVSKSA